METKTIIRIEHPFDGLGLWRSKLWRSKLRSVTRITLHTQYSKISDRHYDVSKFPAYANDYSLNTQIDEVTLIKNYHFAFKDLAQLDTALTKEELKECINTLGFKVLMLDVTEYIESPYQIVFKKETIKSTKDISHLFL